VILGAGLDSFAHRRPSLRILSQIVWAFSREKLDETVGSAIRNFDSWIAGLGFCMSA
jgi:hypothetical protein